MVNTLHLETSISQLKDQLLLYEIHHTTEHLGSGRARVLRQEA